MAAADWLTDEFLASVKRRAAVQVSPDGWSDDDLLLLATDEMRDSIVPMLRRVNEEFLVESDDQYTTAGTARYRLPSWATGETLRDVQLSDGAGGYYSLTRLPPSELIGTTAGGDSPNFYLDDDAVVLVPTPSSTLTLRMRCLRRPSKLVQIVRGYSIASLGSGTVTVSPLDGSVTFETFAGASATLDSTNSAPGFRLQEASLAALAISGNVIGAITTTNITTSSVITLTGESVVPQIPAELHPLLAQKTAVAYLRASMQPGLEAADAKAKEMMAEAIALFTPRTPNSPQRYVNKHGAGMLGRNWRRRIGN